MKIRTKYFPKLIFITIFVLFSHKSYAGAWVNNPQEFSVVNTITYFQYSQFTNSKGETSDQPDFVKLEYKPYMEYGLTEGYSVIFSPSFQSAKSEFIGAETRNKDVNEALVFSELGLKKLLYKSSSGNYALSFIPTLELPGIYEDATTPFFGKNETFWSTIISAGANLYQIEVDGKIKYSYANIETGIKSRLSDSFSGESGAQYKLDFITAFPLPDQKIIRYIFGDKSEVGFGVNYVKSLTGYTDQTAAPYLNRYGYDAAQISLNQKFQFLGLELEYGAIYQFYARNTGVGEGFKFSANYRF